VSGSLFQSLFAPRAIALIGASGDCAKASSRPQRYLDAHGFKGTVVPVNPARNEVFGVRAVANVRDAPCPIDHAFVMVPARAVKSVVEDCAEAGVPLVTVFSDGFADIGPEGHALQDDIVAIAKAAGVRLIGPNSMGVVSTETGMTLTVNTVMAGVELTPGPFALVSQSGSMIGSVLARAQARGLGFSHLVSVGNEADLTVGEITDVLVDDPATGAILLFLETLRGADVLAAAARRAFGAGKPVIAYKLGRSEVGRSLAAGHTGALVGPSENASAFFRHHGIIEVRNFESLFECGPLVHNRTPPQGRKVAVVTTTGGAAATVVDNLGERNVDLMPPPAALIEEMNGLGLHVSPGQIIDLTAAGTKRETYEAALVTLSTQTECDAIVAIVGSSGLTNPDHAVEPIAAVADVLPVAVFIAPEAPQTLAMFAGSGAAAFRTPEACADSVAAYLDWCAPLRPLDDQFSPRVADLIANAPTGALDEARSGEIFAALGIQQPKSQVLQNPDDVVRIAFPLVAKVLSPDIPHKTDAGAVALDIADRKSLSEAGARIVNAAKRFRAGARIEGLLVQEMHQGVAEVIVGFKRDPEVGPIVVLGTGGTLAEIYHDISVRIAPVDLDTAHAMISEVKGLAVIRGYRNLPDGDVAALADAIVKISRLASVTGGRVLEAEINPLIVRHKGKGVIAVDGLIVCDARS
jgi:acyl-CoA synthetase (NDP forming)